MGIIIALVLVIVAVILLVLVKDILVTRVQLSAALKRAADSCTISFFLAGAILIYLASLLLASFYKVLSNTVLRISSYILIALLVFLFIISAVAVASINSAPEIEEIRSTNALTYLAAVLAISAFSSVIILGMTAVSVNEKIYPNQLY